MVGHESAWSVDFDTTYRGREYWVVWRRQPNVYGGRAYLLSPNKSDRKRFYVEAKANAAAEQMNAALRTQSKE